MFLNWIPFKVGFAIFLPARCTEEQQPAGRAQQAAQRGAGDPGRSWKSGDAAPAVGWVPGGQAEALVCKMAWAAKSDFAPKPMCQEDKFCSVPHARHGWLGHLIRRKRQTSKQFPAPTLWNILNVFSRNRFDTQRCFFSYTPENSWRFIVYRKTIDISLI